MSRRVVRSPPVRLSEGRARCHHEPRDGERGLEGYNEGAVYRFVRMRDRRGVYIRIYPGSSDPDRDASPGYHEACGPDVFLRYFEILEEAP